MIFLCLLDLFLTFFFVLLLTFGSCLLRKFILKENSNITKNSFVCEKNYEKLDYIIL